MFAIKEKDSSSLTMIYNMSIFGLEGVQAKI